MDVREYLTELQYKPEEIDAILSDEKTVRALTAAAKKYDEGKTLADKAAADSADTAKYWEDKTKDLQGIDGRLKAAEKRAATAESEAARVRAYNKTLADQGYDVPKEMYEGAASHTPEPPKYMTREDLDSAARRTAPDLVSLTALSNEYRSLFGDDYTAIEDDFRASQAAGKPLRDFARSKYNFDGKRQEKAQKADQERIDKIVAEQMKVKETELAAKYGSNPELSIPMPSKFTKLQQQENFKNDSWKGANREASRKERLKKFENVSIQ